MGLSYQSHERGESMYTFFSSPFHFPSSTARSNPFPSSWPALGNYLALLRQLARLAHASMRGWDREHFLLLLAAAPPLLLQHLRSGWHGWDKDEAAGSGNLCRKCQADVQRLLDELLPKVAPVLSPSRPRPRGRASALLAGKERKGRRVLAENARGGAQCLRTEMRRPASQSSGQRKGTSLRSVPRT